ncbi:MAG TPA: hypothetical protein PLD54_01235 [Candidatus Levybacteria bacterium]|nr:hypothetical protein [Candidatus Levybacteria bacterium]
MNPQFLIAKLAANASDTAWSQAYSTLNFYVALSVTTDTPPENPLAQTGKDTLERLQREYFSLDEKTLDSIKDAVKTTVESIDSSITYSLVLVTNNADTLYIVTAGSGSVTIKRGEKLGVIAQGKKDTVLSFSGPLQNNDLIVVQTADFASKITATVLGSLLDTLSVTEISENIAPHLHNNASGAEAAIVLLYTDPQGETPSIAAETEEDSDDELTTSETDPDQEEKTTESPHLSAPLFEDKEKQSSDKFSLSFFGSLISTIKEKRKRLLGFAIIILVVGLVGSIIVSTRQQESAQNGELISQAVTTAQSEYEEGEALEPLNRPLALEKFTKAQKILSDTKNKYPNDKSLDSVNSLLTKVEQKLSEFSAGKKVENGKKLAASSDLKLDEIQTVSIKGGTLFVTDKTNTLVTLSADGELDDTHEIEASSIFGVSANSEFAFVLTDSGVTRVNLNSGADNQLFELEEARQAIDVFGSNVYLLDSGKKMVEKYAPSSYSASNYFTVAPATTPIAMTIDGSVFVLYDNGKVGKFTRGADDGFNLTGIQGIIGKKSMIYTEEDFSSLYIVDTGNQRLLVVAKNGEVKQEFSWDIFKNATDFAVDEKNKTVYVATSKDLYSFSF